MMGFHQMRLFCHKKSVGRVLHVMTKLNPQGEAVVQYFTNSTVRPQCTNSFTRLADDTSVLAQSCGTLWNTWGISTFKGDMRLYRSIKVGKKYYAIMPSSYQCEDESSDPQPLNTGDMWEISLR